MKKNLLFGTPRWDDWIPNITVLRNTERIDNVYLVELKELSTVSQMVKDNKISLIIPCTFDQMRFLSQRRDELIKITEPICNDNHNKIELLDDKCKFIKFMISNGMDNLIPKVYKMKSNSIDVPINEYDGSPVIYKHPITYAGGGSKICRTIEEIDAATIASSHDYIIQQYIVGDTEYGGHMFVKDGTIRYSIYYLIKNNSKFYIQYGRMFNYTRVYDFNKDYELMIEKIFKLLNFTGFVCVDFKIIDGSIKIFEINPRFGGTLLNNNADFTEMINKVVSLD